MKKKIFGAALIAAMAVAAGWNFNKSQNEMELSDLALANIEALARGEDSNDPNRGSGVKKVDCKDSSGRITGTKCTSVEATPWDTCHYVYDQKGTC